MFWTLFIQTAHISGYWKCMKLASSLLAFELLQDMLELFYNFLNPILLIVCIVEGYEEFSFLHTSYFTRVKATLN